MENSKRIINNEYFTQKEKLAKLVNLLESITVYNWYCGHVTALYAFNHDCVIDDNGDRTKVRTILKANGFIPHIYGGVLSVEV